jgi:hypothetical protein
MIGVKRVVLGGITIGEKRVGIGRDHDWWKKGWYWEGS